MIRRLFILPRRVRVTLLGTVALLLVLAGSIGWTGDVTTGIVITLALGLMACIPLVMWQVAGLMDARDQHRAELIRLAEYWEARVSRLERQFEAKLGDLW